MIFNKPITIQKWDESTETWVDFLFAHASVNKHGSNEYLGSGAEQTASDKEFTVRYSTMIRQIELNTQLFRILYENHHYEVNDYDDYMDRHMTVRLLGTARGMTL